MPELKDIIIIFLLVLGFLGFLFSFGEQLNISAAGLNIVVTPDPTTTEGTVSLMDNIVIQNITSIFRNNSAFIFLSDGSTGVRLD